MVDSLGEITKIVGKKAAGMFVMEKVNLNEMDDAAVEKWLVDQVAEEHRKVRCGEMTPERQHIDGLNERIDIDIVGKGETVDEYWARGLILERVKGKGERIKKAVRRQTGGLLFHCRRGAVAV